jgi:hypothetical protein
MSGYCQHKLWQNCIFEKSWVDKVFSVLYNNIIVIYNMRVLGIF